MLAFRQQILAQYYQFKDYQSAWNPTISAYSASTPFFGNSYITGSSGTTSTTKYNPSRDSLNNQTNSESSSSTLTQFAPGVSLTWTFFDLSRQSLIESGFYALKQQQYLYAATVRDQFLSVQQSYYNLQGSSLIIQYYFPLYENLIKQYSILKEQFASGLIDIVTLSQTRSQLYLTLNQLIGYYNSLFDSSSNLSRNIGVSPDILFTPDSKLARAGNWNLSLQNSLISAEKSREEISAAMSAVESSNQFSRYYIAQYLPTFSLYGSYSVNNNWGNSSLRITITKILLQNMHLIPLRRIHITQVRQLPLAYLSRGQSLMAVLIILSLNVRMHWLIKTLPMQMAKNFLFRSKYALLFLYTKHLICKSS